MGKDCGTTVSISWTRAELEAVREAIEVTPCFDGRADARTLVREAARARRIEPVVIELEIAQQLARRMAPSDFTTAMAKVKLQQALRPHASPAVPMRPSGATRVAAR
jgi:hypothetical protein